jgi:hypothetical protein
MDFLAGLALQAGVSVNIPTGDSDIIDFREDAAVHLKVHNSESPVYAWGSYTRKNNYVLGQKLSIVDSPSLGLGVKYNLSPTLRLFGEVGYSFNNQDNRIVPQQEVVYTYLVGRHNVFNRPVPVNLIGPYDQDSYATTYDISNSVVAKLGIEYQVNDWFSVNATYKYDRMEVLFELYDEEQRAGGGGYWMEDETQDASAVEIQFLVNF